MMKNKLRVLRTIIIVGFTVVPFIYFYANTNDIQKAFTYSVITGIVGLVIAFGGSHRHNAMGEAARYNTDLANGAEIAAIKNLSNNSSNKYNAMGEAARYDTDLATGAKIAAIKNLGN